MSWIFKRPLFGSVALKFIICGVLYVLCILSVVFISKECDDRSLRYTIQPTDAICNSSSGELHAIIVITSTLDHIELRSHHRAGISNEDLRKMNIVRVFLLGSNLSHSKLIAEHDQFNDIVQGNFLDSYYSSNLTFKNAMGLHWPSSHRCLKTKLIIKLNDDSVVDYFHLTHYILTTHYGRMQSNKSEHFLAGLNYNDARPVRDESKWFVSIEEFAANLYPNYLADFLWITTPYTARALISAANRSTPIFWVDDIWITDMSRQIKRISLNKTRLNNYFTKNRTLLECCVPDLYKFKYRCPFFAAAISNKNELIEKLLKATYKQCYNMSSNIMNDQCIERDPILQSLEKTCL